MKVRPTARSLRRPVMTTLALVGFAGLAVPASAEGPAPPKAGRVVAITFDDLPYASDGSAVSPDAAIAAQRHSVGALRRARVPATGFVNEDKVQALGPAGPRLLAEWNQGLLAPGNHGYPCPDWLLRRAGPQGSWPRGAGDHAPTRQPLEWGDDRTATRPVPVSRLPVRFAGTGTSRPGLFGDACGRDEVRSHVSVPMGSGTTGQG